VHKVAAKANTVIAPGVRQHVLDLPLALIRIAYALGVVRRAEMQNRRWSALALTTPGVVADSSGFSVISVRGMSTLLNNVEIDGADDNQAYFSEERGRTREGTPLHRTLCRNSK
jgi:hypothetical protein